MNKKLAKHKQKTKEEAKNIDGFLAPSAFSVSPNHIQIGNQYVRTILLATYPRYLHTNWFSPIINLDRVFDISIYINPKNTAQVLRQLRDQLARLEAEVMEESASGKVRNPILETAIQDIETLRDKLQQGTDRFFELGIYITIYENSLRDLDDAENKIKGMLEYQLIFSRPATFRMSEGFMSTLPLNKDQLNVYTSMNTEPLSSTFPFVSFDLTSNSGILYGINTHNNSLVLYDRFELENANSVVFGKSGGGKSYTVKLEILRSMIFGTQVLVIDPEDEYKYLAETVGGSNIKISINSPHHLNPLDLPIPKADETPADVFKSHLLDLAGLLKLIMGELTPEEDSILDEALIQTYAIKDITPERDFSNTPPPILSDLQSVLEGLTGAESMAVRLNKYTKGTFSGFLNNPTNVSLENRFVVFSIRDMEEELRPIAMYLILNHIWTQVRRNLKKRILVVDEAWWLMKYQLGAEFLFNIAKRARKYYLGLTTITQDIPDFIATPQGKAIVTNSSMQVLMKQSPAAVETVKQTFNLTDAEKYYLLEARVGFGLFFIGQNHVGIRVVASYAEDQIITSDPRQILEVEKAKAEWAKEQS
ncbi:MAG: conjugal transfer protein TraC [Candidatus Yanofskybacteria bacterium RIFCSPHIGHO2_02_FULL_41_29]|uniref:Conjugal transfer protein TraC n=1 Tax=Candidatus Yanofskybacteria bacterium RIFCSPHIGHO2_01_FULL_41_53 TaxID=1802663 RepID=A0A1F8EG48_9BACT|nr:MAG: conjugal transfer protein TraC [Candidatus Yanofskybacteria bacterium RIFCSPHIGHO2_01_FULL_41_53]OGN10893.1 MAG: conjugal transfer protein TraC [Candidatus Yanofskybacteria bacterium RIFCSPHIGHO2_02_FULL_41_29]OGN19314.1 MAG: conjugal transfer protein TraC [Candidatus Yanofskybacteria bacterium RIFCSPHIGHO2_12_FULL_41_9]OGN21756.1 MAG: conjugal transfer protein TraC [Candidatus Yanofskybacteria bacterium RIFCSPLOWO2_01_FULL_41_67]OGN29562.1 MAG: conjugal transfer protein TraC [Candidatu